MRMSIATPQGRFSVRTRVSEAEMFQIAAEAAATSANIPSRSSIETIMRLALHAQTATVRLWAAVWLQNHCGVSVAR